MEWIWILIPLAGISAGIVAMVTEHRQKMAMIEKGLAPEDFKPSASPKPEDTFRSGTITMAIGIAFLLVQAIGKLNSWLFVPAFICICVGRTLLLIFHRRPSP